MMLILTKIYSRVNTLVPFLIEEKPSAGKIKNKNSRISSDVNAENLNNVHNYEIFHDCCSDFE